MPIAFGPPSKITLKLLPSPKVTARLGSTPQGPAGPPGYAVPVPPRTLIANSSESIQNPTAISTADARSLLEVSSTSETQSAITAALAAYTPTSNLAAIATSGSASDLIIGTLANARLSPQVVRSDFSYPDPSWVTTLSASKLIGVIDDARLSSNVPLKNATNTFTAPQTIQGASGSIVLQPSGGATIVQGNLLSLDSTSDTLWLRTLVGTSTQKPIELKGNALWLSTNQWHGDQVNSERVYYIGNGTTINKGYGSTPHAWRNASGTQIASLSDAGNATISGNVTANQHTAGILSAAGTTLTGYIEWRKTTGRQGYIGFDAGNNITAQNEAGGYFCFNQPLQIGSGGNIVRNNSGITEVRNATNSGFSRLRSSELQVVGALGGSIATPGNVRIGLMTQDAAYLAGAITGRTYSNNLTYGDVLIGANPTINVGINDYSNIGDDLAIRGNTGNVEINRGTLRLRNGAWHGSTDGLDRLYFVSSGQTYFKGHGVGIIYEWRDANDAVRMSMGAGGQLTLTGSRPIVFTPGSGIITIQASTGGWSNDLRFLGSGGTHLTGFGANGTNDTLNNAFIGVFGAEIARFAAGGLMSINMAIQNGRSLSILPQNTADRSGIRIYDYGAFVSSQQQSGFEVAYIGGTIASPTTTVTGDYRNLLTFRTGGSSGTLVTIPSFALRCTIGSVIGTALSEVNTSFMVTSTAIGVPVPALTMFGQTGLVNIDQGTLQLGSSVRLKSSSGELHVRNSPDSAYSGITSGPITVSGGISVLGGAGATIRAGVTLTNASTGVSAWNLSATTPGTLLVQDTVNGRSQITITPGASVSAASTQFHSNVIADGHVTSAFQSLSVDPTTLDIPSGLERLVKNTTSGEIRRFVNDGGTIKKSPAYI